MAPEREEPGRPEDVRDCLEAYVGILLRHRTVARWIDGDRGVQTHPATGPRIEELHRRTRTLLTGSDESDLRVAAAALGAVWRPIRNPDPATVVAPELVVEAAVGIPEASSRPPASRGHDQRADRQA